MGEIDFPECFTHPQQSAGQDMRSQVMSGAASTIPTQDMKIAKVKEHIGAIVTGIDLAQPIDAATQKKLYDAVVESVVLVIRGQEHLTPGQLQAAGELFGDPLAVRRAVIDHDRRFLTHLGREPARQSRTLMVVAVGQAEHIGQTLLSDGRVGGHWRHDR